ncbi:gustatory receptor Gr63 [Tribolium castaneum]|uniref:Gustatory receptor n=1 Tax=Tribolium castaneum TaxID=7070 RepID=A2AX63_TRICA|nr:gustatory receptor Gr63 [Tribolium castaneum]ABY40579.1 gustatory receptor [Tribolium castaneum]CAL23134.1 gustatory receptor candidate 1 [Tribolium castaneum]|eukprot:NP_001138956.1 gustatory receptor Gr63 [Tribolium castaneum]
MQHEVVKKFLHSVRIVFVQSEIFCLVNFNHRESYFRLSKAKSFCTFVAALVYCSVTFFALSELLTDLATSILLKVSSLLIGFCASIYVGTVWINTSINGTKFIEFINKLIEFDVKLQNVSLIINYENQRTRSRIHLFVRYVFVTSYLLFDYFVQRNQEYKYYQILSHLSGIFFTVFNVAQCYLTTELVLMLQTRFVILNKQLTKITVKNFATKTQSAVLGKICTLHHHLSKLVTRFNEIFGLGLLLMFAVSFLIITQVIFVICVLVQSEKIVWLHLVYISFLGIICAADVFYICHVCYATIQEVRAKIYFFYLVKFYKVSKSGELIHKIETNEHEIIDKIEMFSLQILNERAEFNAAGFFPIDYTLVFSVSFG